MGAAQFPHGFRDHGRVVFRQPILEEGVGHANSDRGRILGHKRRRPEPRIETMPVHFGLDARQNFIPKIHGWPRRRLRTLSYLRHPPGADDVRITGVFPVFLRDFPQLFPQLWKTLGTDQMLMRLVGLSRTVSSFGKDADCNTSRPAIDTPERRWVPLKVRS